MNESRLKLVAGSPLPAAVPVRRRSNRSRTDSRSGSVSGKVLIALAVIVAIVVLLRQDGVPDSASHPAIGRPAPEFSLVRLLPAEPSETGGDAAGNVTTLMGLPPEGTVTLLHFWGTWCPPCKLEYPELVEMVREFEAEPQFRFVTVSSGGGAVEDYDSLRSQTARYYETIAAGDLETFADIDAMTQQATAEALGESMAYPTTVLIDDQRRIAGVWRGYTPAGVEQMRQRVKELLSGTSRAAAIIR